MGMAARAAGEGKAWGRGSNGTDGEGVVAEDEEDNGESVHMTTESKTGHSSGGGTSGPSKEGSKENMTGGSRCARFPTSLYIAFSFRGNTLFRVTSKQSYLPHLEDPPFLKSRSLPLLECEVM
jgi:hypothetical protein